MSKTEQKTLDISKCS